MTKEAENRPDPPAFDPNEATPPFSATPLNAPSGSDEPGEQVGPETSGQPSPASPSPASPSPPSPSPSSPSPSETPASDASEDDRAGAGEVGLRDVLPASPPTNRGVTQLEMTCWPLTHRPVFAVCLLVGVFLLAAVFGYITGSALYAGTSLLVLLLVLWRLWVPVRIRIGANGIVQTVAGREFHIAWRAIGSVRYAHGACILYRASFASPFTSLQTLNLDYRAHTAQGWTPAELESNIRSLISRYALHHTPQGVASTEPPAAGDQSAAAPSTGAASTGSASTDSRMADSPSTAAVEGRDSPHAK